MRKCLAALTMAAALGGILAATAAAEFGISSFDVQVAAGPPAKTIETGLSAAGGAYTQAGGHPYAIVTHIEWNNHPDPESEPVGAPTPDGLLKDAVVDLPPGIVGNPTAYPRCTTEQLGGKGGSPIGDPSECPTDSQVGVIHLDTNVSPGFYEIGKSMTFPIFNMGPAYGQAARFGFDVGKVLIYLDARLRQDGSYGISIGSRGTPQSLRQVASDVSFWGVPADERHVAQRCSTLFPGLFGNATEAECGGAFPPQHATAKPVPFLTMPTSCSAAGEGQLWTLNTNSWEDPGNVVEASVASHLPPFAPDPNAPGPEEGTTGCDRVPFNPDFVAAPSQRATASPSGLAVHLAIPQDGLLNVGGIAQSDLKKAVVMLPEGVAVNPSQAEGLGVCSPAQFKAASVSAEGCPSTAKIGSVEVRTPLLEETIPGDVYVAEPFNNPSKSLLGLYILLREPQRGIAVKLAGKVELDSKSGQLTATFDNLPQLPFESFDFKFREGPRAPLITPSRCGTYTTEADLYPWARPDEAVSSSSSFEIVSGANGGPCPSGNIPPFHPGFVAGSFNNAAGSFSPFLFGLSRGDGEQDMTKFSAVFPPGLSAKVAGVSRCTEAAIALATEKSGGEERESPSCPENSRIGGILAEAGVGSTLVHAPGDLYLAGPYHGAPLSAVAVTPAVAGPFDLGTVVVRQALSLDPLTAEVHVDGDRSNPIPHILQGIPLQLRNLQVNLDRPSFTTNPTSCDPFAVKGTLFGSFLDPLSSADDVPVDLTQPYQAASCASLGLKPALSLKLEGGTRRGRFPGLRAELKPRAGDANTKRVIVTLPHSVFLEQAHIRTICTRVQFASKTCPAGSIYGHVRAWSPLLDEPLEGPVYLRSSNHPLPDLVLALHGLVDIEAVGRIDHKHGGIRTSFETVPDAPLSKVVLVMQGGKKGLIVNSTDLCAGKAKRANVQFDGQNGRTHHIRPVLKSGCGAPGNPNHK